MKSVYTIIVVYNGSKYLCKCLSSLQASTYKTIPIIIDNASTDNSAEIIHEYNDVIYEHSDVNLGFGKANNLGIRIALEHNADYVFLANQDLYVFPDTLQLLINVAEKYTGGVFAPIQLNGDGCRFDFGFMQYLTDLPYFFDDLYLNKVKEVYEVPFSNAAAWLIKRSTIEKVGGFDPIFTQYGEDNNYSFRLKYHGEKLFIVPSSMVRHDRLRIGNVQAFNRKQTLRNALMICSDINFDDKDLKKLANRKVCSFIKNIFINLLHLNILRAYEYWQTIIEFISKKNELFEHNKTNRNSGRNWI